MERQSSGEPGHVLQDDHPTLGRDGISNQTACSPPNDTMTFDTTHVIRPYRSLDDMTWPKTTAPATLRLCISQLARHIQELDGLRKTESSVRTDFISKRQQYHEQSKAYRKTRSAYETAIDPFRSRTDPMTANETISGLRQILIDERSLFETSAADVRKARKRVEEVQESREKCEKRLTDITRSTFPIADTQPLADRPSKLTRQGARQEEDFDAPAPLDQNLDAMMHLYHQKAADVRLLGEQLADHNYDYWNEVARRELRRDQEDKLSTTDSEFEAESKRQREQITQELSKMIGEAHRLRRDCITASKNGADLHDEDFPDLQGLTLLDLGVDLDPGYEQSLQGALSGIPPEAYENAEVIRGDIPDNGSDPEVNADTTGMISRWRDSLPVGPSV